MLKDIVTVLIRFLAAFSAFGSSTYMLWQSGMNAVYGTQGLADLATYFLVAFLIVVIIAILLWRLSASIAGWLTRVWIIRRIYRTLKASSWQGLF
jgi:hypothetical protein